MKVLYLCQDLGIPVLGRKGASVHVRSMVTALARAGHSVVLASPVLTKSPWEEPAKVGVAVLHLPPGAETVAAGRGAKAFTETLGVTSSLPGEFRSILYNKELRTHLKHRFENDPPDFIYERASLYGIAGALLARDLQRPRLLELDAPLAIEHATYQGTLLTDLAALAERWTLSEADAVLTVSAPLRDYVITLGVEPGRVHVLPNAVDPTLFHPGPADPDVRRRWNLDGGPVLGFVGGLRPWHGVEMLPRLLERLTAHHPNVRLVVAGDGPLRGQLEVDLRMRGLGSRAVLTGSLPHEDVPPLIRQFDVALAPYSQPEHLWYASPLKLFEYMACGVAVVASALGQIVDVIANGETGLIHAPGDVDALVQACDRLLADRELRRRLGESAAKSIHGRYTWDQHAARVLELARPTAAAGVAG